MATSQFTDRRIGTWFTDSRTLGCILAAAFAVRMAILLAYSPWTASVESGTLLRNDALGYHELALCILNDHSFCGNTIRTPGYPAFVALIYASFGVRPWIVLLAHAALDLLTIALAFRLGQLLFSSRVGLIAAGLLAFDPTSVLNSSNLLSDNLFTLVFLAAVYAFVRGLKAPHWVHWAVATGGLIGLATLVRPSAQYSPFVFMAFALARTAWPWRHRLVFCILTLAAFGCTLSPWLWRNYQQFDAARLSTVQGYNLLMWQVAFSLSWNSRTPVDEIREKLALEADLAGFRHEGNPFANDQIMQRVALGHVREHPFDFAASVLRGVGFMYVNVGTSHTSEKFGWANRGTEKFNARSATSFRDMLSSGVQAKSARVLALGAVLGVVQAAHYVMFGLGLWILLRRRRQTYMAALFVAFVLYFSAVSGVQAEARYRMPVIPLYLLIGAVALDEWLRRKDRRHAGKDGAVPGARVGRIK